MQGLITQLFQTGAHYGFSKSRNHPSTRRFIFGLKNRQAIIDLKKLEQILAETKDFLRKLGAEGKSILLVGTKSEVTKVVEDTALRYNLPFVINRWLGGTLTNFEHIKMRIKRLKDLKNQSSENGEAGSNPVNQLTKKEKQRRQKEIERLERYFLSLSSLDRLPAALVVIDSEHEKIAVKEARETGVPVVAICGTDCDIRSLDYPLVANDSSIASVQLLLGELTAAYAVGLKSAALKPESGNNQNDQH